MFRNPLAFASLLLIAFGIFGIISQYLQRQDYLKGKEVVVDVMGKPADCDAISARRGTTITVRYLDRTIIKSISRGQCAVRLVDDKIKVILSPDGKNIFFIDEIKAIEGDMAVSVLISLVGFGCLIKSQKKKNSHHHMSATEQNRGPARSRTAN